MNSANSSETFSPEELVASILRYVRYRCHHIIIPTTFRLTIVQVTRVSEAYLKEDVKDVVITIPSYYTHVERSAIVAGSPHRTVSCQLRNVS